MRPTEQTSSGLQRQDFADGDVSARVARNTLVQLLGRGFTMLLSLASLMILARALGTEGVGNYLLVLSFLALLNVSDMGLTGIGIRELSASNEKSGTLLGNLILIRIALAAVAIGVVSATGFLLGYDTEVAVAIALGSLSYLFLALGQGSFGLTLAANLRMEFQVAGNIAQAVVFIALVGLVIERDLGLLALVLAYDLSILANAAVTFYFSRAFIRPHFELDPALCRRLLVHSLPLALTYLGWLAYNRIDIVMLSKIEGVEAVGLYGVAYRFVDLIWPINFYFVISVYPLLTRYFNQGNPERFRHLLQRSFDALSLVIIPVAAVIIIFAERLLLLIGSSEFQPAATALRLLCLAIVLQWGGSLFSHALMAINKQARLPLIMLAGVFINVGLNLLLIPRYGIDGAALSTVATDLAVFTGLLIVAARHTGYLPSFSVPLKMTAVAGVVSGTTLFLLPDILVLRAVFFSAGLFAGVAFLRVVALADVRQVVRATLGLRRDARQSGSPLLVGSSVRPAAEESTR